MANLAPITSCCVNNANNAWVTCSDSTVYAISNINTDQEPNAVWNLLPGEFIQISCATRNSNVIANFVNTKGELWWANNLILITPNWTKCTSAPKLKYVSLNSDGTCNCITIDNKLIFSNGNITTSNPPFNIINETPSTTKVVSTIPIVYNGYSAIATDTSIYVASNVYSNPKPVWTKVYDVAFLDMALSPNGNLYWIGPTGVLTCITVWSNLQTGSDVGNGFNHVNCNATGLFIAITTDNKVKWGLTNVIKGENNNNLLNPVMVITNYISLNTYASLLNESSNPNISKINLSYGPKSFIQRMAEKGITNFSPFKILSLFDLTMIGRASKANIYVTLRRP